MAIAPPLDDRGLEMAVRRLARDEPRFAHIVKRHGPPPLWPREPGFKTLVLLMLEQQVSLAQARVMYARVTAATGTVTPANVAKLGVPGLRAIGVTRQKSAYLAALANQLESKAPRRRRGRALSDGDAHAALDALHGVGRDAQCYCCSRASTRTYSRRGSRADGIRRQLWRLRERPSAMRSNARSRPGVRTAPLAGAPVVAHY